jgi:inosine-uridine nucleoside N-ribohydrolase
MLTHPHSLQSGLDGINLMTEASTSMYRRALSQIDGQIDIVVTGTLVNIWKLLLSEADAISTLTGYELVARKVRRIYIMGGQYPSGLEANFTDGDSALSAQYVFANCPCQIVASGYEVGATVLTGASIKGREGYDPLAQAILDRNQVDGAPSFDPMCALLACYNDFDIAGFNAVSCKITVAYDDVTKKGGTTTADTSVKDMHHCYVVKNHPDAWYVNQIDSIITESAWRSRSDVGVIQLTEIIPIW